MRFHVAAAEREAFNRKRPLQNLDGLLVPDAAGCLIEFLECELAVLVALERHGHAAAHARRVPVGVHLGVDLLGLGARRQRRERVLGFGSSSVGFLRAGGALGRRCAGFIPQLR